MTKSIILGTSSSIVDVIKAARAVGFYIKWYGEANYKHTKVDDLVLQIHPPGYFKGVEGIVTEMEFDDWSERFPDNLEAVEVLGKLYKELPDLKCREVYFPLGTSPIKPLSEYLDSIFETEGDLPMYSRGLSYIERQRFKHEVFGRCKVLNILGKTKMEVETEDGTIRKLVMNSPDLLQKF